MAAISKVKIANMSLSNIGARSSIESFTEGSAEARQIDLWYDYSRQAVLEAFDWSFARKRLTLATHSEDPPDDVWLYRYQYPVDCISARSLVNPLGEDADAIPFELEVSADGLTKTILTDLDDAVLVYTFDLELTSLFSAFFVDTLAAHLAYKIAISLTGKVSLRDKMLNEYRIFLIQAPVHNANERMSKPPRDAESIRVRV